ncbi:MAG TPA: RNA polymerase sigma factor, partial [Myxococcales bacterium]|nr:RNA polymerase sigma factor [Myxococcales bacterium]
MKENHARILRLALGMLRDPDLADDVAQETFLRAFRFYKSFRNDAALFTWLYRIATNLCIDAQRKRGRTTEQFEDLEGDAEPADPSPTPEHTFEIRELAKQTEAALEALSPNHRAILL